MDKITLSFTREELDNLLTNSVSFKRVFFDQLFADKTKRKAKPVTLVSLAKAISAKRFNKHNKIEAIKELRLASQKYPHLLNAQNSHLDDKGFYVQVGLAEAKRLIELTWEKTIY
jgi:hypothetical protein